MLVIALFNVHWDCLVSLVSLATHFWGINSKYFAFNLISNQIALGMIGSGKVEEWIFYSSATLIYELSLVVITGHLSNVIFMQLSRLESRPRPS